MIDQSPSAVAPTALLALASLCLLSAPPAPASVYKCSQPNMFYPDGLASAVSVPLGYDGSVFPMPPGELVLEICIDDTSLLREELIGSVVSAIATWNDLSAATQTYGEDALGSFPDDLTADFQSFVLHELGHCAFGLGHVNDIKINNFTTNYTTALVGTNGVFDLDYGADGYIGSPDDLRGDDVNLHWFAKNINNPFSLITPVEDCSTQSTCTYSNDIADLPSPDTFAANANRILSRSPEFDLPDTQAVMYTRVIINALNRELTPDDVSGVLLGEAGNDGDAGTGDDFTTRLVWGGVRNLATNPCDIPVKFVADIQGAAAICSSGCREIVSPLPNSRFEILNPVVLFDIDIDDQGGVTWLFGSGPLLFANGFNEGDVAGWDRSAQ